MEHLLRSKFELKTGFAEARQAARTMYQTMKGLGDTGAESVDLNQFRTTMRKLNCIVEEPVVDGLFTRHDVKSSGKVELKSFADALFGLVRSPKSEPEARDVIATIQAQLRQRGEDGFRGVSRSFRLADTNKNGKLEMSEFVDLVTRYGVRLTDEEKKKAMYFFDRNGDGHVDITEIMTALRPSMSTARAALVRIAFLRLDKNEDGQITMNELKAKYRAEKHPAVVKGSLTVDDVMRQFSAAWNKNGDDAVTEAEFLDYYRDLSAAIDNDSYFELMIRNAWRIAGGTGSAANTANLRVCVTHLDGSQSVETIDCDLGLSSKDPAGVTAALRKQGVTDILKVDF